MKRIPIIFFLLLLASSASSQWHKVWTFYDTTYAFGEPVTNIYFLDLPGPPRIGFVGAGSHLYRTSDGGQSWRQVWVNPINEAPDAEFADIYFKDSLTGWFTFMGADGEVCATTNGGSSWHPVLTTDFYLLGGIYYSNMANLLLLNEGDYMLVSTNLGATWTLPDSLIGIYFSFFSDSIGISSSAINDDSLTYLNTTDAGLTWDTSALRISNPRFETGIGRALTIPGSSTAFCNTYGEVQVYRSDDYGRTWRILNDFGPPIDSSGAYDLPAPIGEGTISGDLSRLYIQTDTGMFISTDQGVTWSFDGGPPAIYFTRFYAGHGATFASLDTGGDFGDGSLWEEIWPNSGVAQPSQPASANISVYPNPTTGVVTITGATGAVEVENVLGESVMRDASYVTRNGNAELDISKLPTGTYFVQITGTDGRTTVRRIVKE